MYTIIKSYRRGTNAKGDPSGSIYPIFENEALDELSLSNLMGDVSDPHYRGHLGAIIDFLQDEKAKVYRFHDDSFLEKITHLESVKDNQFVAIIDGIDWGEEYIFMYTITIKTLLSIFKEWQVIVEKENPVKE